MDGARLGFARGGRVWHTAIGGCRIWHREQLGREVAGEALDLHLVADLLLHPAFEAGAHKGLELSERSRAAVSASRIPLVMLRRFQSSKKCIAGFVGTLKHGRILGGDGIVLESVDP